MEKKIADRSDTITEEEWLKVNQFNRDMVQEYLENQADLSPETRKAYVSGIRIFFVWVKDKLDNKKFTEIKKKEFMKYINWLTNRGLSDSGIKFKKSVVSAFCNYVMMMYEEEMPAFRNFTVGIKVVQTGYVHDKVPLTPEEYISLCEKLEEMEEWEKLAYLTFSYSTGCRRSEARQLLKDVVNYKPVEKEVTVMDENGIKQKKMSKFYRTHDIRCKGKSVAGKVRKLSFDESVMNHLKKWLEVRGDDDCPYMFTVKYNDGSINQVGQGTFNDWCSGLFTKLVGRRVHPHLFRESRATNLVVFEGKSPEVAQKLLGHNDVSTTTLHYIIRSDSDDADEAFI